MLITTGMMQICTTFFHLITLSPTEYTLGPGVIYFEFGTGDEFQEASLRVRTTETQWEDTEKLD